MIARTPYEYGTYIVIYHLSCPYSYLYMYQCIVPCFAKRQSVLYNAKQPIGPCCAKQPLYPGMQNIKGDLKDLRASEA
eukprot:scaffold23003_cov23-Prasinocladus_malaysianus.AAC.1